MTEFVPSEKGVSIRYPSTAQLCIDSNDRDLSPTNSTPFDFTIIRNANIMTGFFTRISATEIMLDWAEPNVQTGVNDTLSVIVGSTTYTVTVPQGFYNVKEILDTLVTLLNTAVTGTTFSITTTNGQIALSSTNAYRIVLSNLAYQIFTLAYMVPSQTSKLVLEPDMRLYRYLDITSNQLTYCQDLKDSSTNKTVIDTLCRFYMAYDESPLYDAYGFPILLGYDATSIRRGFSFPKQIRWENNLPIGNIQFQVYGNLARWTSSGLGNILIPKVGYNTNWALTLQVSEV